MDGGGGQGLPERARFELATRALPGWRYHAPHIAEQADWARLMGQDERRTALAARAADCLGLEVVLAPARGGMLDETDEDAAARTTRALASEALEGELRRLATAVCDDLALRSVPETPMEVSRVSSRGTAAVARVTAHHTASWATAAAARSSAPTAVRQLVAREFLTFFAAVDSGATPLLVPMAATGEGGALEPCAAGDLADVAAIAPARCPSLAAGLAAGDAAFLDAAVNGSLVHVARVLGRPLCAARAFVLLASSCLHAHCVTGRRVTGRHVASDALLTAGTAPETAFTAPGRGGGGWDDDAASTGVDGHEPSPPARPLLEEEEEEEDGSATGGRGLRGVASSARPPSAPPAGQPGSADSTPDPAAAPAPPHAAPLLAAPSLRAAAPLEPERCLGPAAAEPNRLLDPHPVPAPGALPSSASGAAGHGEPGRRAASRRSANRRRQHLRRNRQVADAASRDAPAAAGSADDSGDVSDEDVDVDVDAGEDDEEEDEEDDEEDEAYGPGRGAGRGGGTRPAALPWGRGGGDSLSDSDDVSDSGESDAASSDSAGGDGGSRRRRGAAAPARAEPRSGYGSAGGGRGGEAHFGGGPGVDAPAVGSTEWAESLLELLPAGWGRREPLRWLSTSQAPRAAAVHGWPRSADGSAWAGALPGQGPAGTAGRPEAGAVGEEAEAGAPAVDAVTDPAGGDWPRLLAGAAAELFAGGKAVSRLALFLPELRSVASGGAAAVSSLGAAAVPPTAEAAASLVNGIPAPLFVWLRRRLFLDMLDWLSWRLSDAAEADVTGAPAAVATAVLSALDSH